MSTGHVMQGAGALRKPGAWAGGASRLICRAGSGSPSLPGPCRGLPLLPVGQDVAGGPVTEADEEGAESFVPEQLLRLPGQRTCH